MASTKPTKTARWGDGASRTLEPSAGEKTTGWENSKKPPARKLNWLHNIGYTWFRWLDERLSDGLLGGGGNSEDFAITPPTPAAAGGVMSVGGADAATDTTAGGQAIVKGGDGVGPTTGVGGSATVTGGDSAGSSNGGSAILSGGDGGSSGGGGGAFCSGGNAGAGTGGAATLAGGAAVGTDQAGASAIVKSGAATGDGSADVDLQAVDAGQGAGATGRAPATYLKCNGATQKVETGRDLMVSAADKLEFETGARTLGDLIPNADGADDLGVNGTRYGTGYLDQLNVVGLSPNPLVSALQKSTHYLTNAIGGMAKIDFYGASNPVLRTPHHNVATVTRTGVGVFDITLDFTLDSNEVVPFSNVRGVYFHYIEFKTGAVWTLKVFNSAGAAVDPPLSVDGGFCFVGADT